MLSEKERSISGKRYAAAAAAAANNHRTIISMPLHSQGYANLQLLSSLSFFFFCFFFFFLLLLLILSRHNTLVSIFYSFHFLRLLEIIKDNDQVFARIFHLIRSLTRKFRKIIKKTFLKFLNYVFIQIWTLSRLT